jgi:phytoene/squalene synthetase
VSHSDGPRFANELASALALTRVVSKYESHWRRGRVYFPLADLAEFRCAEADLATGGESLKRLLSFESARARSFYRRAAERIAWLGDDGSRMMVSLVIVMSWSRLKSTRSPTAGVSMRDVVTAWRLARRRAGKPLPTFL